MKCYDGWRGLNVISKADHTTAKCTAKVEKGKREANDEMKSWSESVRWLEYSLRWEEFVEQVSLFARNETVKTSGGASAVKESGHFEVRKSSSQVTLMHFFFSKSLRPFSRQSGARVFLVVALKTQAANAEAKQCRARQGGGSSSQVIWPGAPWCSSTTGDKVVAAGSRDHENDTVFELFKKRCSKVKERE